MKTKIAWISTILLLVVATSIQAQPRQKGYVKTKGRLGTNGAVMQGTRLANVSIVLQGDNSTVSDANGNFTLLVSSNKFNLKKVQKQGYVVSDPDVLSKQYTCSANDLILVLETSSEQLEDKLTAERKIRRTLQRQLQQREDEIEELKEQNKITQEEYQQRLQKLYADQENDEKLISEMAERYSKMDYDQIDEFNRKISEYILNGELKKADSLLNTKGNINDDIEAYQQLKNVNAREEEGLARRQENYEKSVAYAKLQLEDLAQRCYNKFEICQIQHQLDSAAYYIEKRAALDSLNTEWSDEAANFLIYYIANYEKALTYYMRILEIQKATLPENHLDIAACYNQIAVIYSQQGLLDKALEYHLKTLEIRQAILPEKAPEIAFSYYNIAYVYSWQAIYDKALEYYQKAWEIWKETLPENHQTIATIYYNIAKVYATKRLCDQALEYHLKALEIFKATLSENHPHIASSYSGVGIVYHNQGLYDQALQHFQKALEIYKATLPENHPNIAIMYNNIAEFYEAQSQTEKAREYRLKAEEISKKQSQ